MRWRWGTVGGAVALLAITAWMAGNLGGVFVPRLGEGAIAIQPTRIPSIALTTSVDMQEQLEQKLKEAFPDEIAAIFARTGTAEVATDPMGPNVGDTYLMLHPRNQWTHARTQEQLAEQIEEFLRNIPGQNYEISQPIELRFNELISGIRSDVAVKIFGDDMEQLLAAGENIARLLQTVEGAADVKVEQVTGLSVLTIDTDRAAIARYGLNVSDVQQAVRIAFGGEEAGILFEGDRRFPIVVRIPDHLRENLDSLKQLPIPLPKVDGGRLASIDDALPTSDGGAGYLPLEALAEIRLAEGPNQISRENAKRRIVVQANVRGRDIASFVHEAQREIDEQLDLPEGYWIEWGGQFENLIAARQRLMIVVPAALFLIFVLLFMTFGSARDALLVFTGVPLALTGGVIALWLWDMPFSISAGIGFIALSGVSVLNGLVLVSFIRELLKEGSALRDAVVNGSLARFRQIVTVGLVASLGFVPMALNTGMGAEVQRPLATVVIGGLISSTLLTLIVLPTLYLWLGSPRMEGDTDQRSSAELANGAHIQ
ncbi:MAG: efflux RND transporter permease subunit, partial [Phycisphaerae bacterium]